MPFLFEYFPTIRYDIKKNMKYENMKNTMLRFKINQILKTRRAEYFSYSIEDGERADVLAYKIYEDATLDWLIFLTNDIYDPYYDWPLSQTDLISHIRSKYGSVPAAQSQVKEYRKILNPQSVLFDGTVIPKRTLVIDSTTYSTLPISAKEIISMYDYELELNEKKRDIKLIEGRYIGSIISQIESLLEEDE
jgi:hypothetical protein